MWDLRKAAHSRPSLEPAELGGAVISELGTVRDSFKADWGDIRQVESRPMDFQGSLKGNSRVP